MATPYANSVPIEELNLAGLPVEEAALIDGMRWGTGGYGSGVSLTYSFPWVDGQPYAAPDYLEWAGSFALNAIERIAVTRVLNAVTRAANISFTRVADDEMTVGELRFTGSTNMGGSYAYAYLPFVDTPESGDVWFSADWSLPAGTPIEKGSYEYSTIVHEVGHALGLRHPFEEGAGLDVLPPEYDHYAWTVMSYTAHEGAGQDVWADFYPTTLMYLDLVALQEIYGPSQQASPGDTRYVYREDRTYWETLNDSGGIDTIVYEAASSPGFIDLSNVEFSRMGRAVHFSDGTFTRDTICMGPSTLIENATGGGGDDRLIGNRATNRLIGMGGEDTLVGAGGNDVLQGGSGADRLLGGEGNDVLYWSAGDRCDGGGRNGDRLRVQNADLDLTRVGDSRIVNVEAIDLRGGDGSLLTLRASDVLAISSTSNTLTVMGDGGDSLHIAGRYTDNGAIAGGYHQYAVGGGRLVVDEDISVV